MTDVSQTLTELLTEIRACTLCADELPCGPRPVLQAGESARLRIIGQAPGRRVHETGIPWDDPSGVRLREWIGVTPEQFYDPDLIAIIPMGFCYPGKAQSGDLPPLRRCATQWQTTLNEHLPNIELTLLVGQYAQAYYLRGLRKPSLTETVRAAAEYLPLGYVPLPHPSPRNQPWLVKNPWFEHEVLPIVRDAVRGLF